MVCMSAWLSSLEISRSLYLKQQLLITPICHLLVKVLRFESECTLEHMAAFLVSGSDIFPMS